MKLVKFEPPDLESGRQRIIDKIKTCKSMMIICNNEPLTYEWFNLSHEQAVAALELVKLDVLKEMM